MPCLVAEKIYQNQRIKMVKLSLYAATLLSWVTFHFSILFQEKQGKKIGTENIINIVETCKMLLTLFPWEPNGDLVKLPHNLVKSSAMLSC
jgi:hypothetical protein